MSTKQMRIIMTKAKEQGLEVEKMSIKDFISFSKTIKSGE